MFVQMIEAGFTTIGAIAFTFLSVAISLGSVLVIKKLWTELGK